jgi:hypothetical protein
VDQWGIIGILKGEGNLGSLIIRSCWSSLPAWAGQNIQATTHSQTCLCQLKLSSNFHVILSSHTNQDPVSVPTLDHTTCSCSCANADILGWCSITHLRYNFWALSYYIRGMRGWSQVSWPRKWHTGVAYCILTWWEMCPPPTHPHGAQFAHGYLCKGTREEALGCIEGDDGCVAAPD